MENLEKDIRLKTKLMGFDKKTVMDFIEQIQLENESLKREVQELKNKQTALLKENAMLRAKIDVFADGVEKAAKKASGSSPILDVQKLVSQSEIEVIPEDREEVEYKVTYEDLGSPAMPLSTVQEAVVKKGKPASKYVVSSKKATKGKVFVNKK